MLLDDRVASNGQDIVISLLSILGGPTLSMLGVFPSLMQIEEWIYRLSTLKLGRFLRELLALGPNFLMVLIESRLCS